MDSMSNSSGKRGIILMYHRVAEVDFEPWSISVSPRHFAEQLEILSGLATPLRLGDICNSSRSASQPSRWAAITFDDGYADNLHQAARILKQHEMPATFFLASQCLGSKKGFWWDELEQILLKPGTLPPLPALKVNGKAVEIGWGFEHTYTEEDYQRNRSWRMRKEDTSPRHRLFRTLYGLLHSQPERQRVELLDKLRTWSGKAQKASLDRQVLSIAEATALAREKLFDIGSHTLTHSNLAALPVARQREEIMQDKASLERLLGCAVDCFSYPYGEYTPETVALVREAGFVCAVTLGGSPIYSSTDRFQLPRLGVWDWPAQDFAERISGLLSGNTG